MGGARLMGKGTVAGKVLDSANNVKAFWSYFARLFSFGSFSVVAGMLGRLTCRGPDPGGESLSLGYRQVSCGTGQSNFRTTFYQEYTWLYHHYGLWP